MFGWAMNKNSQVSSSDLIDAKLEEHQLCGSKHCPGCGHKLEGKPVRIFILFYFIFRYDILGFLCKIFDNQESNTKTRIPFRNINCFFKCNKMLNLIDHLLSCRIGLVYLPELSLIRRTRSWSNISKLKSKEKTRNLIHWSMSLSRL